MNPTRTVAALGFGLACAISFCIPPTALAQTSITAPANPPPYFMAAWQSALSAPLPSAIGRITGSIGSSVGANELDVNAFGFLGTNQPGGATVTATNAFFESLGTNGRACSTCHQPAAAMSINKTQIALRYLLTAGNDPLFAPVDGANCPNQVPAASTAPSLIGARLGKGLSMLAAHSLILNRGVFRIFLPVPAGADYTISVVSDPTTCNIDPNYSQVVSTSTVNGATVTTTTQMISVFRRPRLATNLKFATTALDYLGFNGVLPPIDLISGAPFGFDPTLNIYESGNIMWDGREPTLESQAQDATMGHAQATGLLTSTQLAQIVAFEKGIFSAQASVIGAGALTLAGGQGGPVNLEAIQPAQAISLAPVEHVGPYDAWASVTGTTAAALKQESIFRGQTIFNTRPFTINNVSGFNDIPGIFTNPTVGTCSICHNQIQAGNDAAPGAQHDIGIGGTASAFNGPAPAKDLPIFKVSCTAAAGALYDGSVIYTNDPGLALISGKCADVGRTTVPQLRGLAAHAPYFHDGSAQSLTDVVNFYNKRFAIGLSAQDTTDLVNFLGAL